MDNTRRTSATRDVDRAQPVTGATCPTCRTRSAWHGNPHRPFCSLACRLIDLGRWIDGHYRIESDELIDDDATPADLRPRSGVTRTERHVS